MSRRASVHPYRLPLTAPLAMAGRTYAAREGVLLRLEDADGHVGWGDAAPLPCFSGETLAQAHDRLTACADGFANGLADETRDLLPQPPSVQFAIDLAQADLRAAQTGRTLPETLAADGSVPPSAPLPLAGLILGGDAVAQARALAAAGYGAVKLKVGRDAADAAAVRAVRDALPERVALRLDANRAWSPDAARRFADAIAGVALAFIEEPLADPDGLEALAHDTGLPVALDESLHRVWAPGTTEPAPSALPPWAAAVVLKPTLLGAARTLALAAEASALGAAVVLSGAFESGVGMRGVAALAWAAAAGRAPDAAGLDPYRRLARDVLAPRLPLDQPVVSAEALFAPRAVALP